MYVLYVTTCVRVCDTVQATKKLKSNRRHFRDLAGLHLRIIETVRLTLLLPPSLAGSTCNAFDVHALSGLEVVHTRLYDHDPPHTFNF